ncbi:hypothetical protein [Pelodictyon luteolum]|nr:hypothetical protein [Pelodictyon luteolum]
MKITIVRDVVAKKHQTFSGCQSAEARIAAGTASIPSAIGHDSPSA